MQAAIYPFDRSRARILPQRRFLPGDGLRLQPPGLGGGILGARDLIPAIRGRILRKPPLSPLSERAADPDPYYSSYFGLGGPGGIGFPLRPPIAMDPPMYNTSSNLSDRYLGGRMPPEYLDLGRRRPLSPISAHDHYHSRPLGLCSCYDCVEKEYRHHDHCSTSCKDSPSSSTSKLSFKTKDVTIRGKAYAIRKAFLEDNGKFEKDLVTYVDKQKDSTIPTAVIAHLVDIINDVAIVPNSILDLVTLNILASNVGVKSAIKSSQASLDKYTYENPPRGRELVDIVGAVMLSSKVDEGLTQWLKKYLKAGGIDELMFRTRGWRELLEDHPEVYVALESLLGYREKPDDEGLRIQ